MDRLIPCSTQCLAITRKPAWLLGFWTISVLCGVAQYRANIPVFGAILEARISQILATLKQ